MFRRRQGAGVSKSAASRHFVALSAERMKEWMGADLSKLDIMVVQIDGIHISEHLVLVAALGIDSEGLKHPLGLMEGATEHSAVVQALIDDLIERGLDPAEKWVHLLPKGIFFPDVPGHKRNCPALC